MGTDSCFYLIESETFPVENVKVVGGSVFMLELIPACLDSVTEISYIANLRPQNIGTLTHGCTGITPTLV